MHSPANSVFEDDASRWCPLHFSSPERALQPLDQTAEDSKLVDLLKRYLQNCGETKIDRDLVNELFASSGLPAKFSRLFLVLYSGGHDRIVISRAHDTDEWGFAQVFERLLNHPRRPLLIAKDYQLQIDFMEAPSSPARLDELSMEKKGAHHFEIGVDGLSFQGDDGKTRYFLPGDAYVRSIASTAQLHSYFHLAYGEPYLSSARVRRFRSSSFLLQGRRMRRLYRGIPVVAEVSKEDIKRCTHLGIALVNRTQDKKGQLLHFCDPISHPSTDVVGPGQGAAQPVEYNLRQHCGATLASLLYAEYAGGLNTTAHIQRAIAYVQGLAEAYELKGREAAFIRNAGSSSVGAAGLGLYLMARYERLTGDQSFRQTADALARHTLNQISESGKGPGAVPRDYPGEALCGLAHYVPLLPAEEKADFLAIIGKALDGLLASDSGLDALGYTDSASGCWLIRGILALWDFAEMRQEPYADFVFREARKSIDRMYKVSDAPYPDYAGAFYDHYGAYPHNDGARIDGLICAFELARKMNRQDIARKLWPALRLAAWSLLHTFNHKESTYCIRQPRSVIGGVRHTLTGQGFGVATIHPLLSFYIGLLRHWDEVDSDAGVLRDASGPRGLVG